MAQVSYGTITITDTTDLTTYIRYATKAPLTAASQFQETPTTDTRYIAVLSIPTSDSIPAWNSSSWKWSEFIGTDGLSVKDTRVLYYLKTNSTNVPQVDYNTSIVSTDTQNAWTSKNPTYVANGTYWTCLEVTLSNNTTKSWSAPAEDLGLTQAAKDAAVTKSIAQHASENAQGALGIARAMQQNFWWWGEDHTVDSSFTLPAGAYTSDIKVDAFKANPTGGYLVTRSDGVYLNNGRYVLMGLTGSALKFYRPGTTKLLSGTETVDAQLTSSGLQITNGSIVLGSTSGTAAGNVTLSNVDFTRSINGTQRDNLRLAIGSKFGVKSDGTLYASNAVISGKITVGSGSDLSAGLSNYSTTSDMNTAISTATGTKADKTAALSRSQRIYYRSTSIQNLDSFSGPTTWLSTSGTGYENWSLSIPQLMNGEDSYPYLYTCVQNQTAAQNAAGSVCTCTPVVRDDSTTVIDGGSITTGQILASYIEATGLSINSTQVDDLDDLLDMKQNAGDYITDSDFDERISDIEATVNTLNGQILFGDDGRNTFILLQNHSVIDNLKPVTGVQAKLTSEKLAFGTFGSVDNEVAYFSSEELKVQKRLSFGNFVMKQRDNGHLSIMYEGGDD